MDDALESMTAGEVHYGGVDGVVRGPRIIGDYDAKSVIQCQRICKIHTLRSLREASLSETTVTREPRTLEKLRSSGISVNARMNKMISSERSPKAMLLQSMTFIRSSLSIKLSQSLTSTISVVGRYLEAFKTWSIGGQLLTSSDDDNVAVLVRTFIFVPYLWLPCFCTQRSLPFATSISRCHHHVNFHSS